jgi:hypothetical protein
MWSVQSQFPVDVGKATIITANLFVRVKQARQTVWEGGNARLV